MKRYIFRRKNESGQVDIEKVDLERWAWAATYWPKVEGEAGEELHQFDSDGNFHQFQEIDQERVRMFTMYKTDENKIGQRIDIMVEQGNQIFHFYRNVVFSAGKPDERRVRVYVFGWKDKKTGSNNYHYILPDDRIIIGSGDLSLTRLGI